MSYNHKCAAFSSLRDVEVPNFRSALACLDLRLRQLDIASHLSGLYYVKWRPKDMYVSILMACPASLNSNPNYMLNAIRLTSVKHSQK